MTITFIISSKLEKVLDKIARKDKVLSVAVRKKIEQIISCDGNSILHFKNMKHGLSGYKRVHTRSFVLFFKVKGDTIIFDKLRHHDDAY